VCFYLELLQPCAKLCALHVHGSQAGLQDVLPAASLARVQPKNAVMQQLLLSCLPQAAAAL
jgi:hypothetical protein